MIVEVRMGLKTWLGLKQRYTETQSVLYEPAFSSVIEAQYFELNASFGRPIAIKLTTRGFYSEMNGLLNVMLYGLIKRRRVVVDLTDFEGLQWSDLFASKLPIGHLEGIPVEWVIIGSQSQKFSQVRQSLIRYHERRDKLVFPKIGLVGGVLQGKSMLAKMLFRPHVVPEFIEGQYAAFHIRRGDKLISEGENTPPLKYIKLMNKWNDKCKNVFVMTDDFSSVEELRNIAPEYSFQTLCDPAERGYDQVTFSARTPLEKKASLQRLLSESQMAARSDLFLGGFKSNVGRFITLLHSRPDRCVSVDSQTTWYPG